jgi:L-aminopeptidase/D-esterase-like protein
MTVRPGARNALTDVAGILVGQAEDLAIRTGVTVVLAEPAAIGAVDVRGGAPGTIETDALAPGGLAQTVDAIVLAGGSAFGLDAAAAVKSLLARRGRGFRVGPATVPIVPGAILFDLLNGGDKNWGDASPYGELGRAALLAAGLEVRQGNAGAGTGAVAGLLKGGTGTASAQDPSTGATVAALVAVNSFGAVTFPNSPVFWAWHLEQAREFGGPFTPPGPVGLEPETKRRSGPNTTIGVVATDAALDRVQTRRLAVMAQDGLARAIRPIHTPFDGDTLFALATGRAPVSVTPETVMRLGALAADCVARAVCRAVHAATDLGELRSWHSLHAASRPSDHASGPSP